ncbi:MFS transporter [Sphingobium algorifonticola]|uniref:MFS transporter n=1 Tax=Sphingobium algorifonticola TaxID=2008318 RepID=A0A437J9C5_9SPHN|nr:MFS transporter [Sphingobium algorifonticola]RVT41990.1 MFS transporter [Sphingobium algorifonticola]
MTVVLPTDAASAPAVAAVDDAGWRRAEAIPLSRRIVAFAFLLSAYFCYAWSWNTVDVLRPYIAESLGLSLTEAGTLYSAQALGALMGAVINGQLADRFGRRNALVVVMASFGLLLLSGIIVASYWQVLLQRLLLGYFMGTMYPITVGIYVTLFPPAVRGRLAGVALGVYNASVALLGTAAALALDIDWRLLLYIGVVPVVLAPFALLVMPDDRKVIPHGGERPAKAISRLPIAELFQSHVRRQTLLLVLMCGLNFFAYQAFSGWMTTYLKQVRGLDGAAIGTVVSALFWGSCVGGFAWGWFADRYGRKIGAFGFVAAAILIVVFLGLPAGLMGLSAVGFMYGFAISSSVVWGPWLAELYPPHLRSTAASIFNWGRVISFFAPIITAGIAERFGLAVTMTVASLCFLLAALVWSRIPETLRRPARAA